MILHAVGRAYHENGVVEKRERALGFGRKIDVTGGVKEDKIAVLA